MKLLHSLAADPGIVGVMNKHGWAVGKLSEMPPEGKVGVSPVCILGVNINAGQEISLRLRTDDLKVVPSCAYRGQQMHTLNTLVVNESWPVQTRAWLL